MNTSSFLKSGDVKSRLRISQRDLQTISPSMLCLYLPPRKTCLWPRNYINALSRFLRNSGDLPTTSSVSNFAQLPKTSRLIRTIQLSFALQVSTNKRFTVSETAHLLGVGEVTVRDWLRTGVITSTSEVIRVKQGRGEGCIAVTHIPAQEIRRVFEWRLPTT